jgi:signal transduction histidine kinase/CheY-like chemotaxis protein
MKLSTANKLRLLVVIFIFGFTSLFFVNKIFTELIKDLDKHTKNLKAKIQIGEFIAEDILKAEALFFQLGITTTSKRGMDIIIDKLDDTIANIEYSLDILQNGGTLKRMIKLNIAGHLNDIKKVTYTKNMDNNISIEVISIRPKLKKLRQMIDEAHKLLILKSNLKHIDNIKRFRKNIKNIRRFYKTSPAFFTRMSEDIRRLLYEGDKELKVLNKTIQQKKLKYLNIKLALIIFVIVIVVLIGHWISNIINRDTNKLIQFSNDMKKKETSMRLLLDAQPNIIIVSDGFHMLDTNARLFEFFEQYETFEQFKKDTECICDYFEKDLPNDDYITKKDYEGLNWTQYILANPQKHFKVIMKKNGKKHHFSISLNKKVLDEDANEMLVITTLSDITQEVEVQEALIEKTHQADLANKAKSEFLANMSHEIRTPLNAILGFVDLLKTENYGRKSLEYVYIIDSSSQSLLQIIEDILDFSKIESGKLEIDKIDFEATKEFMVITHLFSAKCSQKNITLELNIDKNMPKVINTDPLRIKQVISNLLSNAVKFTEGGKKITVDIKYNQQKLFVSVADEGKGIAKGKLDHIFDAFSQEDNSTTREYGGTGLGLSISTKLIELLGGELKVKSELGVGSEFYFTIPVGIGKLKEETKEISTKGEFENKKVLLVEDNPANQMFMKIVLKQLKMQFILANDGVEAVDKFKTEKFDVVLMDENMPNMNGIEATKLIRVYEEENNLPRTPIVALTANALKGDREKFLGANMDEYLTKPINKQRLSEAFNIVL